MIGIFQVGVFVIGIFQVGVCDWYFSGRCL